MTSADARSIADLPRPFNAAADLLEPNAERRPDKAALKKLVWEKPLIHAARDIGVSDVALRKQCLKLGIQLPATGYWLRQR